MNPTSSLLMLTSKQKKRFRTIGHALKPVVTISSNAISLGVNTEIERALKDHELIKIKILAEDRALKKDLIQIIINEHNSNLIQLIGNIALIYRAAKKPNPALSNVIRSNIF